MNKYCPIGSIVMIENDPNRYMILGYGRMTGGENGKIYDYVACKYPDSFISVDEAVMFNAENVVSIIYLGLQNVESMSYEAYIAEVVDKARENQ